MHFAPFPIRTALKVSYNMCYQKRFVYYGVTLVPTILNNMSLSEVMSHSILVYMISNLDEGWKLGILLPLFACNLFSRDPAKHSMQTLLLGMESPVPPTKKARQNCV